MIFHSTFFSCFRKVYTWKKERVKECKTERLNERKIAKVESENSERGERGPTTEAFPLSSYYIEGQVEGKQGQMCGTRLCQVEH